VACLAVPYLSTLSQQQHDFRKKKMLLNMKCMFWFSLQILSENISHPKENSARHYHKCTVGLIKGVLLICQILTKFEIYRQIYEKMLIYKISWKSVQWDSRFSKQVSNGQKQYKKHDKAIWKLANAPRIDQ
jgi:hypothetical protein